MVLQKNAITLLRLPLILIVVHFLLMIWAAFDIYELGQTSHKGKPPGDYTGLNLIEALDFPVADLAKEPMMWLGTSTSTTVREAFDWMELNSIYDFILAVYWRTLFVLGTAQWFLIGLSAAWLIRVVQRWRKHDPEAVGGS